MNIILIRQNEINEGVAVLTDDRHRHILKVLKSAEGSTIKAGILGGMTGTAKVIRIDSSSVVLEPHCADTPPKAPSITVALALPRPKVFRRVLFGMVCAGIKNIHIINSWRVDKSYWDSPYLEQERLDEYCFDALSQARDTIMPKIMFHRYFMGFMEQAVPEMPAEGRYFAHPYGAKKTRPQSPCSIVIGCEGGFIEKEVKTFADNGFTPFSLGDRILTTEYAVPYILGMLA